MSVIEIAGRPIGPGHPPYVVAELSGNHNQSLETAVALVKEARARGADAVKLQTYTPDTMTLDLDRPPFRIEGGLWGGRTLYDLYKEAYTPWEWQPKLMDVARELGMACFSTPFDETAVDFLEGLGVPAYKVASFELADHALLDKIARTRKPVLISTGLATLAEIDESVRVARGAGVKDLVLLHCVSAYPAPAHAMNLCTIPHLAKAFDCVAGLSDHTLGNAVAVASVALGASVIEKHFTLARAAGGPDSAFSMEPSELEELVRSVATAWQALGKVEYRVEDAESENKSFRRSLFVVKDVKAGTVLTKEHVRALRPGAGLPPRYLPLVLGARAVVDISRGTPLAFEHLIRR
ncbi:MAG: pseudaminic acid synthase [Deltaproteobacteria bacterium]|nr:pseudaminic acid synthase [Deltaproteobacteria bacterium]